MVAIPAPPSPKPIRVVPENNLISDVGLLIKKMPKAKHIMPNAKTFLGPNLSKTIPKKNVTRPHIIA